MKILGITGSIGTGKSTVIKLVEDLGIPTQNCDTIVANLLRNNMQLQSDIVRYFPFVRDNGEFSLSKLPLFLDAPVEMLIAYERVVHPLVFDVLKTFIAEHRQKNTPLVVIEIPLLYETESDKNLVDYVAVTHVATPVQRARALARPQITPSRLFNILSRQLPNVDKLRRADYVIHTCFNHQHVAHQVARMLQDVLSR